jgi:benzil reductase ((S)-benzoin forming)
MKITDKSLSIITGGTGGLGQALSNFILENGGSVLFVGRNVEKIKSYETTLKSEFHSAFYKIQADVRDSNDLDAIGASIKGIISSKSQIEEINLFNNASSIDPISLLEDVSFDEISNALIINISAAYTLSSLLLNIKKTTNISFLNIINISSGVSINPVKGWSAYCISKAGLNMLSKCISVECDEKVLSLSINPGAIDTSMQEKIRNADEIKIPATKKFDTMYNEGKLQNPKVVADKLFRILEGATYSNGDFIDFNKID